jgi:epsilon-lactone hydrolase
MIPSMMARIIGGILRTTGVLRRRYSDGPHFDTLIAQSRVNPQLPTDAMKRASNVSMSEFDGRPLWHFAPKTRPVSAHMLYFHGGGYVYPAVDVHWKFFAHLVRHYGLAITVPLYPLAPESNALQTTDWAGRCYRDFLTLHDGPFVLGGDSAGGGLAAVVAQSARDQGLRQASGLLLICPWLDVSLTDPSQPAIEPRDCVLTIDGARAAGRKYAGGLPLDDPRVSPVHGNWGGLPQMLVYGGADDILLPDARGLAAKLPSATYVEGDGLMHDWPIFFLPESRRAQAQMADFIMRCIQE